MILHVPLLGVTERLLPAVINYVLFCSTPELGALTPFVFKVCGSFYICRV